MNIGHQAEGINSLASFPITHGERGIGAKNLRS